jgi:O-antigen/teichoic acid export membrane protein
MSHSGIPKQSSVFLFTGVFITIYYLTGIIMLKYMSSLEAVGIYSAAYRVLDALHFIPGVIISATFPAMSFLFLRDKNNFEKLYKSSLS